MSNETSANRYLRLAFQLNPMWQAEQLMDLRSRVLRLPRLDKEQTVAGVGNDDLMALKIAARQQIQAIQSNFWKLPLDSLQQQLANIDVRRLPELAPVVERLRTTAACRAQFPPLSQESWMDPKLFNAFKTAVVLPPAEAGHIREFFLSRIGDKHQLKGLKKAAQMLEAKYPVLYELERDWFQTLSKHKVRNVAVDSGLLGGVSIGVPEISWPIALAVLFVVRILIRIMMSGGN